MGVGSTAYGVGLLSASESGIQLLGTLCPFPVSVPVCDCGQDGIWCRCERLNGRGGSTQLPSNMEILHSLVAQVP